MPSRKLLEVVQLLTPEESKRAAAFLKSPFFNSKSNASQLCDLFAHIQKFGADEKHPALEKSAVSKVFFPEKPFRENEKNPIDSLASDLFALLRRFLTFQNFASDLDEHRENLALAKFYFKQNLQERFEQTTAAMRKSLDSHRLRDAEYFKKRFELEGILSDYQSFFNTFEDDANLLAAHRDLDTAFAIQKLEMSCMLHFQRFVSHVEDTGEADALLHALTSSPHLETSLTKLYALVLEMLRLPDPSEKLDDFEQMLQAARAEIPAEKFSDLQSFFRFFAGRVYVKRGGTDLIERLFDLYERHLDEGFFYRNGQIHANSLRLLVNFALKLRRTDWAKNLLENHPPERITGTRFAAEAHSVCLAEVFFYEKNFNAALDCLNYRLFENVNYRLVADVLLVKIYFSLGDELLESRVKALDQKVRRSRISAEMKLSYQNFLKVMEKILRLDGRRDAKKSEKLVAEIRELPAVLEREWLISIVQ